jgi:membrane protease YdiL (CAAX protease family)
MEVTPDQPTERPPVPWSAIEAIPVALLALLPVVAVAALVPLGPTGVLGVGLLFEALLAGVTIAWVRSRYRAAMRALRLPGPRPVRDALLGAAGGVALFAATFLLVAPLYVAILSLFAGEKVALPEQPILPGDPSIPQVTLGGVVAVVAAPAGEEIFFRGFLHAALRRSFRFVVAAAFSSLAFALFHVTPLHIPLFFFVGFGLAWVFERWGSLAASIAAHMAFNVVGYALLVLVR